MRREIQFPDEAILEAEMLQAHEVVPVYVHPSWNPDQCKEYCNKWCECPDCADRWNNEPLRAAQRSRYGQRHRRVRRIIQRRKHGDQ